MRQEVTELAQRFGPPAMRTVTLGTKELWARRNRMREVCMVIRRPNGRLLTFTKTFYPPGLYRLLTGGVEPGERVQDALLREVREETGLRVAVRRLLTVVVYRPEDGIGGEDGPPCAYTFAFLLDEVGGTLGATDPAEQLAAYGEIAPEDLRAIAAQLDDLPDVYDERIGENWREWGRFRAVIHRVVGGVPAGGERDK